MNCKCLEVVQEHLAVKNAAIVSRPTFEMKTGKHTGFAIMLQVEKIDKKKRSSSLPWVACRFCPFCGKKC